MSTASTGPRPTQQVTPSLLGKINAYAVAAGAAGVSIAAMAQPAACEIVYTPTNEAIPVNQYLYIDLDHDGSPDFRFLFSTFVYHSFLETLRLRPLAGGMIVAGGYAAALVEGASIGPARMFADDTRETLLRSRAEIYVSYHRSVFGPWANKHGRYVGVKFLSGGAIHYGWIRLTVTMNTEGGFTPVLLGYAYETSPAQAITAGQLSDEDGDSAQFVPLSPPSLGILALGWHGLDVWRKEMPDTGLL